MSLYKAIVFLSPLVRSIWIEMVQRSVFVIEGAIKIHSQS